MLVVLYVHGHQRFEYRNYTFKLSCKNCTVEGSIRLLLSNIILYNSAPRIRSLSVFKINSQGYISTLFHNCFIFFCARTSFPTTLRRFLERHIFMQTCLTYFGRICPTIVSGPYSMHGITLIRLFKSIGTIHLCKPFLKCHVSTCRLCWIHHHTFWN